MNTQKGAENPHTPHAEHIEEKRLRRLTGTLQHAFGDDGDAIKGLGEGNKTEHKAAEGDNFLIR